MIRSRATNRGGNRAGGRARAKVTSHRAAPKRAVVRETKYGRALCPVCRTFAPLGESGKLRSHKLYIVPCTGSGESPTT